MRLSDVDALEQTFRRWLAAKDYNEAERHIIRAAIIECQHAPTIQSDVPRVLTLEEMLSQAWDYCYIEAQVRPHSEMLEKLCGTHRLYCTTSTVLERQTRGDKEYGKTWRCWTARPEEKVRIETPWRTQ